MGSNVDVSYFIVYGNSSCSNTYYYFISVQVNKEIFAKVTILFDGSQILFNIYILEIILEVVLIWEILKK